MSTLCVVVIFCHHLYCSVVLTRLAVTGWAVLTSALKGMGKTRD